MSETEAPDDAKAGDSPDDGDGLPAGFDSAMVKGLVCPENLTELRIAGADELAKINARIEAGELKRWDGSAVSDEILGALLRADDKIAYELKSDHAVLLIESALVLDAAVGDPDPEGRRAARSA